MMALDPNKKKYYIQTYGCQMNVHDSEQMAVLLLEKGYISTDRVENADLIILNTCNIREKAAQKVYSQLGRFKNLKQFNPNLIVAIGGCLAQQLGERFCQKAPFLDLVFGTHNIHRLPELLDALDASPHKYPRVEIGFESGSKSAGIRTLPQNGKVSAFVTIMQGCDNYCSYCVVPFLRGPEKSREGSDIIAEIENLVSHGIKEVTLLGQNVNSYGNKIEKGLDFVGLLREIAQIDGIERIRFTTSHPKDLSPSLIRCFTEINKLCEHIHLPFQSGSDRILKAMNRKYTKKDYLEKVEDLRNFCPQIGITSDVIVGFPGETDDDFQETISLMEKIKFDNLFSFKYSERDGTAAVKNENKVSDHIKTLRLSFLQKLQEKHTLEKNKALVGQIVDILVEGRSKSAKGEMTGRTRSNKIVNFEGDEKYIGSTIPIYITEAYQHSLRGLQKLNNKVILKEICSC